MRSEDRAGSLDSPIISGLAFVYFVLAAVTACVAGLGKVNAPAPLQTIDGAAGRGLAIAQAHAVTRIAQRRTPENPVLAKLYRGWLLERDLYELRDYSRPLYEGHSFDGEIDAFNRTVALIDEIYSKATTELAVLSAGGLLLSAVMLLSTGFLRALLLAGWPVAAAFICIAFLDVDNDYLEQLWIPFVGLGALIFVLQLVRSFRFGRPEHRTPEGEPGLVIYRRGLALVNLGAFLMIIAVLMATGSLSGSGSSGRVLVAHALLGDGGIAALGLFVGVCMLVPGVYYITRKATDDVI